MTRRNFLTMVLLWILSLLFGNKLIQYHVNKTNEKDSNTNTKYNTSGIIHIADYSQYITNKEKPQNEWDWTNAIEEAYNSLLGTGGVIKIPAGSYKFTNLNFTSDPKKAITIQGVGVDATNLYCIGMGIKVKSYLFNIENMSIIGTEQGNGIEFLDMSDNGDNVIGRASLRYLQISKFENGIKMSQFDQFWIEKCSLNNNSKNGIYIHSKFGSALLNISDTITNHNGENGIYIYSSGIIGHISLKNAESISNSESGLKIEGKTSNSIISTLIENIDIEGVKGTNNSALILKNIGKFIILGGQYSAARDHKIFASILLENSKTGLIINPWFRSSSDGMGDSTHYIYATKGTKQVYLMGSEYFGKSINFAVDNETNKNGLINFDNYTTYPEKKYVSALELIGFEKNIATQNNPNKYGWTILFEKNTKIKSLQYQCKSDRDMSPKAISIYWYKASDTAGKVVWEITMNNKSFKTTEASGYEKEILKSTIEISSHINSSFFAFSLLRKVSSSEDNYSNAVNLLGIELEY